MFTSERRSQCNRPPHTPTSLLSIASTMPASTPVSLATALVLVAALVLAGCEGEGVSNQGGFWVLDWRDRLDENTIRQISELKNKPAGTYEVKVTGAIKNCSDLSDCMNAQELPANVLVHLDLSGISSTNSTYISGLSDCKNLAKVTLPSICNTVVRRAFAGCTNLVEIAGLENVTSIGGFVFSGCTALTRVSLPQNLGILEEGIFSGCTSLKEITLPNSVNTIKLGAFSNCTGLKKVLTAGDMTTSGGEGVEMNAFVGCSSLTEVTIPASVTSIGLDAFWNCSSLTSVTFVDTSSTWRISNGQGSVPVQVNNPQTNATNLKTTYSSAIWTK